MYFTTPSTYVSCRFHPRIISILVLRAHWHNHLWNCCMTVNQHNISSIQRHFCIAQLTHPTCASVVQVAAALQRPTPTSTPCTHCRTAGAPAHSMLLRPSLLTRPHLLEKAARRHPFLPSSSKKQLALLASKWWCLKAHLPLGLWADGNLSRLSH